MERKLNQEDFNSFINNKTHNFHSLLIYSLTADCDFFKYGRPCVRWLQSVCKESETEVW